MHCAPSKGKANSYTTKSIWILDKQSLYYDRKRARKFDENGEENRYEKHDKQIGELKDQFDTRQKRYQ